MHNMTKNVKQVLTCPPCKYQKNYKTFRYIEEFAAVIRCFNLLTLRPFYSEPSDFTAQSNK